MGYPLHQLGFVILIVVAAATASVVHGGTFTLINNCQTTVWVATQSNAGITPLQLGTSAMLSTGQSIQVSTPDNWGGRFWGRTGCSFDSTGAAAVPCTTGDCGQVLNCGGTGGKPPATLAEFTLAGYNGKDYYDVSLVDGYNLPLSVFPTSGGNNRNATDDKSCTAAGCTGDLNRDCPAQLQVRSDSTTVGCRSACDAFGGSEYCCTGPNNTPQTCPPTDYSRTFKNSCPKAYSYAYDDKSSIFTCEGGDFTVTFCPTSLPSMPEAQIVGGENQVPPSSLTGNGDIPAAVNTRGGSTYPNGGGDGNPSIGTNFHIITPGSNAAAAGLGSPLSWWRTLVFVAAFAATRRLFFVA